MKAVVFHMEDQDTDVWSGRQIDLDCWWYSINAWGLDAVVMIDLMTGGCSYQHATISNFFRYSSLDEFELAHSSLTKVYFETPWSFSSNTPHVTLQQFIPPTDNFAYIFGPAAGFQPQPSDGRTWVTVPQLNRGALHSIHIAPIVLCDRAIKLGLV